MMMILLVMANERGRAQAGNRQYMSSCGRRNGAQARQEYKFLLEQGAEKGESPVRVRSRSRTMLVLRVAHFGSGALKVGSSQLKLNIGMRPIVYKYREGSMKSTLKRELKVPEITQKEAKEINELLLDCVC